METKDAIELAAAFLIGKRIRFVEPVKVFAIDAVFLEVIFTVPEALDPNVVIDPPDIRVLVDSVSKKVALVPQM